jgi:hypothetical protein
LDPGWDPDLGGDIGGVMVPRYGTSIWDPDLVGDLVGDMGSRFGTPIWDTPIWDPDLGPRFGTPIFIEQNYRICFYLHRKMQVIGLLFLL